MAVAQPPAKKRKKVKKPLEAIPAPAEDSGANCSFARALGSVDWHTREQGLQALTLWLTQNEAVAEQDLAKIWKALFFCFWHSDQAHIQAELAERLAGILLRLSPEGGLRYFRVFAATMQREWFGIDRLRLDKFMMLARKFMRALFLMLRNADWDAQRTAAFCGFLADEVFTSSDAQPSAGFSMHLADVAVAEVCAACEDGEPVPAEALQAVLEPFCVALAQTKRPALAARLQDGVFGALLERGCVGPTERLDTRALAERLFELGARQETRARNREVLYALSKAFERAAAKRQKKEGGVPGSSSSAARSEPAASPPAAAGPPAAHAAGAPPAAADSAAGKGQKARMATSAAVLATTQGVPAGRPSRKAGVQGAVQNGAPSTGKVTAASGGGRKRARAAPAPADSKNYADAAAAAGAAGEGPASAPESTQTFSTIDAGRTPGPKSALKMNGTGGKKLGSAKKQRAAEAAGAQADMLSNGAGAKAQLLRRDPAVGTPGTAGPSTASPAKKVKFALKKNLYFTKGGPIPAPELRTPPTAQPKGSALKHSSLLQPKEQQPRTPKSPKSVPRAKAAMFF